MSADGRVQGCYLHGLFAADAFRTAFLARLRPGRTGGLAYEAEVERTLDRSPTIWRPTSISTGC